MFSHGNQFSERFEEIKRLEIKYKLGSYTDNYKNNHQSYISGATLSSSTVRAGLMIVGGNKNLSQTSKESSHKNLKINSKRTKPSSHSKPPLANERSLKDDKNLSISGMLNPGIFC